jgi:uncharacterized membrane protein
MLPLAHHVAVEILGREFSPRTPLEHACVFAVLGFVLVTSAYGTLTLARKALQLRQVRARA